MDAIQSAELDKLQSKSSSECFGLSLAHNPSTQVPLLYSSGNNNDKLTMQLGFFSFGNTGQSSSRIAGTKIQTMSAGRQQQYTSHYMVSFKLFSHRSQILASCGGSLMLLPLCRSHIPSSDWDSVSQKPQVSVPFLSFCVFVLMK